MTVPSTKDLLALVRKDSALMFNLRDAAQAEINANEKIVAMLGNGRSQGLEAALEEFDQARGKVVEAWNALVEFDNSKAVESPSLKR